MPATDEGGRRAGRSRGQGLGLSDRSRAREPQAAPSVRHAVHGVGRRWLRAAADRGPQSTSTSAANRSAWCRWPNTSSKCNRSTGRSPGRRANSWLLPCRNATCRPSRPRAACMYFFAVPDRVVRNATPLRRDGAERVADGLARVVHLRADHRGAAVRNRRVVRRHRSDCRGVVRRGRHDRRSVIGGDRRGA